MHDEHLDTSPIDSGFVHFSKDTDSSKDLLVSCFFPPPREELDDPYVPKDGGGSQWYTPGDHAIKFDSLGLPLRSYHPVVNAPFSSYQAQASECPSQRHSPSHPILPVMGHSIYGQERDGYRWANGACAGSPYSCSISSHHGEIDGVPYTYPPFSLITSLQGQERPYHAHTGSQVQSSESAWSMPYVRLKHDYLKNVHVMEYFNTLNPRTHNPGSFLRMILNIPVHIPVHLSSLRDPRDRAGRPPYSILQLAAVAIYSNSRDKASAAEIRNALMDRFEYFRHNESQLKDTLKHALSRHSLFQRAPRASTERGKGDFWYLDLSDPFGSRPRRRIVRILAPRQRSCLARVDRETTSSVHSLVVHTSDSPPCSDSFAEKTSLPTFLATDDMLQSHSEWNSPTIT